MSAARHTNLKLLAVLLVGAAFTCLVLAHAGGANGSIFHRWTWRGIPIWRIAPPMFLAAIPLFLSQSLKVRPTGALALMMLSTLGLQLVAVGTTPDGYDLGRVTEIVGNRITTSYFTDATLLDAQPSVREWIDRYDEISQYLTFHSKEKPPGPILYYLAFLKARGASEPGAAALWGGLTIILLSTLCVPACYALARTMTGDSNAALQTAAFLAISPCLILICPMFDQIYPAFACGMLALWIVALRTNRYRASALFGIVLSLAIFFSYSHLVLGAFVVGYALLFIRESGSAGFRRAVAHAAIGCGVVLVIYSCLWLVTGFNPIATFFSAVRNEADLVKLYPVSRAYPQTLPDDLKDFFLGSGWISLPLLVFGALRLRRQEPRAIVWLGLIQIAIVLLSGLLRAETARVWMFLQPLALIPVGIELSRWNRWQRVVVYLALGSMTVIIAANMSFVLNG